MWHIEPLDRRVFLDATAAHTDYELRLDRTLLVEGGQVALAVVASAPVAEDTVLTVRLDHRTTDATDLNLSEATLLIRAGETASDTIHLVAFNDSIRERSEEATITLLGEHEQAEAETTISLVDLPYSYERSDERGVQRHLFDRIYGDLVHKGRVDGLTPEEQRAVDGLNAHLQNLVSGAVADLGADILRASLLGLKALRTGSLKPFFDKLVKELRQLPADELRAVVADIMRDHHVYVLDSISAVPPYQRSTAITFICKNTGQVTIVLITSDQNGTTTTIIQTNIDGNSNGYPTDVGPITVR